jgi:hypothetical protein
MHSCQSSHDETIVHHGAGSTFQREAEFLQTSIHLTIFPMVKLISENLEKHLLDDIEQKGLPFDDVSLALLCDNKELICGGPSSDLRRSIQKHFNGVRLRAARNCQKLLLKHNITPPGPLAFHCLREEEEDKTRAAAADTIIKELSVKEEDPSIEDSASESSNDNPFDIARAFDSISTQKSPPAPATFTPINAPSSRKGRVPPFLSSSPGFASPIPAQSLDDASVAAGKEEDDNLAFALWTSSISVGQRIRPSSSWLTPTVRRGTGQRLTSLAWRRSSTTTTNAKDSTSGCPWTCLTARIGKPLSPTRRSVLLCFNSAGGSSCSKDRLGPFGLEASSDTTKMPRRSTAR